jgi:hypothetical protein
MAKSTGVEAHARPVGESCKSADDGVGVSDGSHSMEMRNENGDVDPEVVALGIEALERKQKHWYSYVLTRDFWIVLVIG